MYQPPSVEPLEKLLAFARALGAVPRIVGAAAHDRLLAFLSHLPQLTASALMHVVGEAVGEDGLSLAGRGLVDTARLASSPAEMWRDIALANRKILARVLGVFIEDLQEFQFALENQDVKTIEEFFVKAKQRRDAWRAQAASPSSE